jgi:integrase
MARERHQDGWLVIAGKRVKKWEGHWWEYRTIDGREKRVHRERIIGPVSKLRKWQAEGKLRAIIEKEIRQPARVEADCTFGWFYEHRYLPTRTWDEATKSTLESIFKRHILPTFEAIPLARIDKLAMQAHLNALASAYSRSVVKKVRTQLAAVIEEAIDAQLIVHNPARKLATPRTKKPCGRFMTMEEYGALLTQVEGRDRVIVRLAVTLGLRPGELFALRQNDVEPGRLRIDESLSFRADGTKETKTEASDAYARLPRGIEADLRQIIKEAGSAPDSLLFQTATGTPISPHNFERDVITPAAVRAGIMKGRPKNLPKGARWRDKDTAVNFQAFRRTFATWLQKTGSTAKDYQGAMRHASPEVTLGVYMKEIPGSVAAAVDALDSMLNPATETESVQ